MSKVALTPLSPTRLKYRYWRNFLKNNEDLILLIIMLNDAGKESCRKVVSMRDCCNGTETKSVLSIRVEGFDVLKR